MGDRFKVLSYGAADALDELCVSVWDSEGSLRKTLDVWHDVKAALLELDDADQAWHLSFYLAGPMMVSLRERGCTLEQALGLIGFVG